MDQREFELLKRQHRFEEWAGRNRLAENLFIDGYFIWSRAVPGWQLMRCVPLSAPGMPHCIQSLWRHPNLPEALLRFDTWECYSRLDAHEFLVRFLGEIEASDAGKAKEGPFGDVGFAWLSDFAFAFARGNLVMFLSNAGRDRLPIAEYAQSADADLISKPVVHAREEAVAAARVVLEIAGEGLKARAPAPLRVEVREAQGEGMYLKIFSKSGEVVRGPEGLEFHPESPGQARITVYTVTSEGAVGKTSQGFAIQ
jgi:hypothetical protein